MKLQEAVHALLDAASDEAQDRILIRLFHGRMLRGKLVSERLNGTCLVGTAIPEDCFHAWNDRSMLDDWKRRHLLPNLGLYDYSMEEDIESAWDRSCRNIGSTKSQLLAQEYALEWVKEQAT